MTKITSQNFEFLRETAGAHGNVRTSLTIEEIDKFCKTITPIVECMSWKSKIEKENVRKIVTILQQAADSARTPCEENNNSLPFYL
jgi:hypothetical protein